MTDIHVKDNKRLGCDNVQTELIKYRPDIIHQYIANLVETDEYPEKITLENNVATISAATILTFYCLPLGEITTTVAYWF